MRSRQRQKAVFTILVGLAMAVAIMFSVQNPCKAILLALGPLVVAALVMFPARRERKMVFFALVFTAGAVTLIYLSRDLLLERTAKLPTPPMAIATWINTVLSPAWPPTPQGQIAFVRDRSIWVIGADGQGKRRLTKAGVKASTPAWAPGGGRLAYAVEENGTWQIWTILKDGTQPHRLTWDGGYRPTWSPDGRKIAYQSKFEAAGDIMVISAAGGSSRRLTKDPAYDGHPAWSPDGQYIAFASARTGTIQIWLMRADGSSLRQLTTSPKPCQHPAWSPDGRYLAYEMVLGSSLAHIYVMDMHSGESRLLNNGSFPAWSPDGQFLVVRMNRGATGGEMWILRAEGVGVEPLLAGNVYHFAWKK